MLAQTSAQLDLAVEVMVWIVVCAFAVTFVVTILGILQIVTIRDRFLIALFGKMMLEIVIAGLFLFYKGVSPDHTESGLVSLADTGWNWPDGKWRGKTIYVQFVPEFRSTPRVVVELLERIGDSDGYQFSAKIHDGPDTSSRSPVTPKGFYMDFFWPKQSTGDSWPTPEYARNIYAKYIAYPE